MYALKLRYDSTNEIRYVGISSRGVRRLKDHFRTYNRPAYVNYHRPVYRWMRKHYAQVVVEILEECSKEDLFLTEMKWIHILKARGHRLLNATEGGEGFSTYTPTPDHIQKMRENILAYTSTHPNPNLGRKFTKEQNGMYGKKHSAETRYKIGTANRGKQLSESHRAKISAGGKGKGGRDTSGPNHPQTKLTVEDVHDMRARRATGELLKDIASSYGISITQVGRIVKGQSWGKV